MCKAQKESFGKIGSLSKNVCETEVSAMGMGNMYDTRFSYKGVLGLLSSVYLFMLDEGGNTRITSTKLLIMKKLKVTVADRLLVIEKVLVELMNGCSFG